jgi:hypothetical protein
LVEEVCFTPLAQHRQQQAQLSQAFEVSGGVDRRQQR